MNSIVLADTKLMTHQQWLDERKKGIGGSDAGTILGVNKYKNPVALWLEKTGQAEPEPVGEPAEWGNILEPVIANRFELLTGIKIQTCDALLQHPQFSFMLANVDRLIAGERRGLECKNVSLRKAQEWDDDEIPDTYYAQCQHYMAVTGYEGWYIAALINGNHFIHKYIPRNDEFILALIDAEQKFWHCCQNKVMPDCELNADVLKMLYPTTNGVSAVLPDDIAGLVEKYEGAKTVSKDADKRVERIQVAICAWLGEKERAKSQDGQKEVVWSQVNPKPKFNEKKFAEDHPKLFESYLEPAKPYRRFSVKIKE